MSDQIGHDEVKKEVLDAVKVINIENTVHTAPFYSLSEILALKNVTRLRQLGKALQVKYYGKLSKQELIPAIVGLLKQVHTLRDCLFSLTEIEWEFFQKVVSKRTLQTEKVYITFYLTPQSVGLLQGFYHDDKLWFVVPDEIRDTYRNLAKTGFIEDKRFRDLLNNYAVAAVSLYGVISQDDFVALWGCGHFLGRNHAACSRCRRYSAGLR